MSSRMLVGSSFALLFAVCSCAVADRVDTEPASQDGGATGGAGGQGGAATGGSAGSAGSTAGTAGTAGTSTGGSGGGSGPAKLVINEVDYDDVDATESHEFVEIMNTGSDPASLTGVALVLVNGATGLEYGRVSLAGTLAGGGYLVVADPPVTVDPTATRIAFVTDANSVQNGGPDGVLLFDTGTNQVVDALSYEGSVTSAQIDNAPGSYNLVEGSPTSAEDSNIATGSLIRTPNGKDTDNAAADWSFTTTPTPGAANVLSP